MTFNPRDHYHAKAKQHGFKARAVYKLEEIDKKFHIFSKKTQTVLDLGCAPGSWMQYAREQIVKYQTHASDFAIVGLDILPVDLRLSGVHIYQDSITNLPRVGEILTSHDVTQLDVIMSDAAPNTSGIKDLDAERSIQLIIDTLPIYEKYLHPDGRAVIKVFMWAGFDDLVATCKQMRWGRNVKVYKPDASRSASKEVYIVKRG